MEHCIRNVLLGIFFFYMKVGGTIFWDLLKLKEENSLETPLH